MNWKWEKYTSIITECKPLVKSIFALIMMKHALQ
jgi:hypothetical protein